MRRARSVLTSLALPALAAAQEPPRAAIEPDAAIAGHVLADTDGDGSTELVLFVACGRVLVYAAAPGGGLALRGSRTLRDPNHALVACVDLLPAPGIELVVADRQGIAVWPWPIGEDAGPPRPLAPRARFLLRTDAPRLSPFVRDLDGDGRRDLLLPTSSGCQPWLHRAPPADANGAPPTFEALPPLPLPVESTVRAADEHLDDVIAGRIRVPQPETEDLNGDGRPDLIARDGDRWLFHLQQQDGTFAAPVTVDVTEFQDTTPRASIELGATAVFGDRQHLQRGDLDGDHIPDFVIAHRRKVWTFLSDAKGPQFTRARTQATAEDTSALLLVDLDDDARADLLSFQVRLPGVGDLVLGLVRSVDVDVHTVGYRSGGDRFEPTPHWRRTVTVRLPPLLTVLGQQEELVKRFLDIVGKSRWAARGAFAAAKAADLALASGDGRQLELYPGAGPPPELGGQRGRRMLRELLFEDPDTVFDLDRMFALLAGFLDERAAAITGGAAAARSLPLRDPGRFRIVDLRAADNDGDGRDEVLVVYAPVDAPERRAFDLLRW